MEKEGAQKFYDSLSADYDSMIGFDASLTKKTEALKNFIMPGDTDAVDLGCGSGLDSIALTQLGLNVTGFDISENMIQTASNNAARLGVNAKFYSIPVKKIAKAFNGNYLFAVSLGNSLANINGKDLALSFKKIYSLLKPGGHILIQILNYDRILKNKERLVGVTEKGNSTFVRFYDFQKENTFFNILKIDRGEKTESTLITTEIFPYRKKEMKKFISGAGFKKIKFYGSLDKKEFSGKFSQDLVITAFK